MSEVEQYLQTDNWFDYQWFYKQLVNKGYKKFVEVGVWKGHSISFLANLLRNVYGSQVFAVDLFENSYKYKEEDSSASKHLRKQIPLIYDIYNENLRRTNTRRLITDLKGASWAMSKHFADNTVDVVFIDADHAYESVKKDIISWLPKVRNGGVLSGHDYRRGNTVSQAVDELNRTVLSPNGTPVQLGKGSVWYVEL